MNTYTYIDDDGTEYEVTFEYDPFIYGEEDPSLSALNYVRLSYCKFKINYIIMRYKLQ